MKNKLFELTKRNSIIFAVYLLLFIGLFILVIKKNEKETFITQTPSNAENIIEGIYNNVECRQYFEVPKNSRLEFISIQFATYSSYIDTDGISFTLYSEDDIALYTKKISGNELQDNAYFSIVIDKEVKNKSGNYYFEIKGTDTDKNKLPPAIWCSENNEVSTSLYINNEKQDFNMNAVYKYSRIKYSLYIHLILQFLVCIFISFFCFKNISNKTALTFINLLVFLTNFVFIEWFTENIGIGGIEITFAIRCMTYILMLCVQLVIFGICGNVYLSIIITDIFLAFAAIVNYFVMIYRGVTIVPSDLFSVGTLVTVMDTYFITFTASQLVLFMWLLLWLRLNIKLMLGDQYYLKWSRKKSTILRKALSGIIAITTGGIGIFCLCNPDILETTGIISYIWNRNQGYFDNGPFMNFMVNVQYAFIKKPEDYSIELAQQYLKKYENTSVNKLEDSDTKPNIIIIMNESLADFESYENNDVTFSSDPLPFIHSLEDNTIKGDCYVSIFGSATSNSEMEALTGHSMAFFPNGSIIYQQFPQDTTSGLVSSLKRFGYSCIAVHPCARTNWNRDKVYESMGFDMFYSEEDFDDPEMVRWISDKATYDKIIELYEEKEEGETLFVFDVTMQGHGGYTTNYQWDNFISVEGESFPQAEEYLSSTHVSDEAFEYLISYFENEEEPVLIFMFGDHQPSVENEFFELLLGKSLTELTLEETQRRYVTPYLLWTNYELNSSKNENISANQISKLIKQKAGLELSSYDRFIQNFSKKIPLINANGYMDNTGKWYSFDEESRYEDLMNQYRIIQYAIYCDGLEIK